MIQAICRVSTKKTTARHPEDPRSGFCRGNTITLEVDESRFISGSLYVFAKVLEVFFSLYSSINSFTQLTLTTTQRGEVARWKPRLGSQTKL